MNVELRFLHAIAQGTFCMVIAPEHLCFLALEGFVREDGVGLLYICGNFSRILGRLDRRCPEFRVRRAFTAHQLLAILEEADCRRIVLEHDPTLYDDASDLALPVGLACADRARDAPLVLLAARADPALRRMARCAHRIVSVEQQEVPGRRARQPLPHVREQQTLDRAH
ncbi:MAG TPA: hypothetical protein ENN85_06135 [Methanoculleus sp.]|mgnify:CR=1 FL=1|nr:hypothetical protein [Methanoculleus sp.]